MAEFFYATTITATTSGAQSVAFGIKAASVRVSNAGPNFAFIAPTSSGVTTSTTGTGAQWNVETDTLIASRAGFTGFSAVASSSATGSAIIRILALP